MKFLRKFLKKEKKAVSLPTFENVEKFLGSDELTEVKDSRSTIFFKEASSILKSNGEIDEEFANSTEVLAMQSFIAEESNEIEKIEEIEKKITEKQTF